jgi:hypothetical protein
MTRHSVSLIASTPEDDGRLNTVFVRATESGPVIKAGNGEPERELVLVQEYRTGTGSKRSPNFLVEFGDEVTELSSARTHKGSGGEAWMLVSAPMGWAENIAAQFVDERGVGAQTISFNPDFDRDEAMRDVPEELFRAFGGDAKRAESFMDKVYDLDVRKLDEHIIRACGRKRVKSHLEEVSGDRNFFLGADPNRVVRFVEDVCLNGDIPTDGSASAIEDPSSSGESESRTVYKDDDGGGFSNNPFADAFGD